MAILGSGGYANQALVLIDGFAGPGRYRGGEQGSPLLMLDAYLDHSGDITARCHFHFIEENGGRAQHLRDEIAAYALAAAVEAEVIEGSFDKEFPPLIDALRGRFGGLPATFAFIDPGGPHRTGDTRSRRTKAGTSPGVAVIDHRAATRSFRRSPTPGGRTE